MTTTETSQSFLFKSINEQENSIVKYDHKKMLTVAASPCDILVGNLVNFDAQKKDNLLDTKYPPVCLELIDSDDWIKKYGLKTNKLTFENILSMIGFKKQQDYLQEIRQIVTSKYSRGLFLQTQDKNGLIYNITVNQDRLIDYSRRLEESIKIFKLRLKWLNSDSRRLFGVFTDQSICLVVDCKTKDPIKFSQYRNCIIKLLKEQISKISSFNIIRCSDKIEFFRERSVVVSAQSIEEAIEWLNEWNRTLVRVTTDTITCESVILAFRDKSIEAICLISEGLSSNGTREILFDKIVKESKEKQIKLNVVSFDCVDPNTVEFLRRLALNSYGPGKFHAYCLLRQYEDYTQGPIEADPTKSKIIMNKRVFGGAPPGSGVKTDLMLIFEEIQIAMEALENIKALIETMTRSKSTNELVYAPNIIKPDSQNRKKQRDDEYLTSKEWLEKHGLGSKNLDLFDVLNKVCFRHCDGVVDLKKEPITGKCYFVGEGIRYYQGDSIPATKLVNAKYCDQFAHVLWNDGTVMHVHVTPDLHRSYEQKINICLQLYEKRIDWLSKGSRELFGTVIENNICILIDTSQSMQLSLDFVKRKLEVLMQEQLKAKQRFNLISFNTKINPWRDRMVEVDEFNIKSALEWIKGLNAQGTTNTLAAIRFALSDLNTEAIYLLSDGRPDQEPRQILAQVHLNTRVPVHTISFNCNDSEANKFLSQLAKETNGRYHYFNENGWDADPDGPVPYQSEDISVLKKEIDKGLKYLNQMAKLREECSRLSVSKSFEGKKLVRKSSDLNSGGFQSKYGSKHSLELSKSGIDLSGGVLNTLHDIKSLDWVLPETRLLLERQFKNELMQSKKLNNEIKTNVVKSSTSLNKRPKIKDREFSVPSSYSRIKKWLATNSLSALKLTIFDALLQQQNNKLKNSPDNILVVDEIYEAKIWKEILDCAENSSIVDKQKFKLINPSKIDLYDYESKLENQIQIYKKYLAEQIWSALPDREKQILDYKQPSEFDESNRNQLLKSLDYSNWPINKQDIELVEKEIHLAKTYLRQSRELSAYFYDKSNQDKDLVANKEYKLNQEEELESKKEPEVTEKTKLLIEQMNSNTKKEDNIVRGDKVIARNDALGYYFNAKICKFTDSRHVNVKFEDGTRQENMSLRNMIKLTSNYPYLSLGDYVMSKVVNEFNHQCWVPGIVQTINQNTYPKQYTILFFNGQEGDNIRPELLKINKSTYGFIVNYIRSRLGLNTTDVRTFHEEKKPIAPEPRAPTPPDLDDLKKEIVDQIKDYFGSLKLDHKYQKMYEELLTLRKKHKSYKTDIEGKLKLLRHDFDDWRKQDPPVLLPDPNKLIYVSKTGENDNVKLNEVITKKPTPTRELNVNEKLLKLRTELPELRIGEEVLAKWPDDGWYYRSIVKDNLGNYKYQVEDSLRDTEQIYREDIISEINDSSDSFESGDPVVALHPHYEFSYAPGQVVKVSNDMTRLIVRFYDFVESVVLINEAYRLPLIKFQLDVDKIVELEKRWIGETVVARNNYSNVYELGKIVDRIGNGRQYAIEWSNGKQTIQNANHIFGKHTRNQSIIKNDYVLAPKETIFLPGRVMAKHGNQLRVKFVDGIVDENVNEEGCFWLSRDYYEDACNFYKHESEYDSDLDKESARTDKEKEKYDEEERDRATPIINAHEFHTGKGSKIKYKQEIY